MTTKQKARLIESIVSLLIKHGYELTKYGTYMKRDKSGSLVRYKFTKIGLRKESQLIHSDGTKSWVRINSDYIKDLSINESGKLVGMSF